MTQPIDREMRELRRAGQRLEIASKEWSAAYRQYLGALHALSRKTMVNGNGSRGAHSRGLGMKR